MKQLPIRGKKKIPQVQKGFLENKQNSFPVRREKGFDIQVPCPQQRSLLCSGQGGGQERGKLRGENRRQTLKQTENSAQFSELEAQSNASFATAQGAPGNSPTSFSYTS